jgi:hypothetical protein
MHVIVTALAEQDILEEGEVQDRADAEECIRPCITPT